MKTTPTSHFRHRLPLGLCATILFVVAPVAIEVVGRIVVVNVNYAHTLVANNGEKTTGRGRWNATLVKEGPRWLFLSCTYSDVK